MSVLFSWMCFFAGTVYVILGLYACLYLDDTKLGRQIARNFPGNPIIALVAMIVWPLQVLIAAIQICWQGVRRAA